MPRVENVGSNVNAWYNAPGNGNGSSTHDVCKPCGKVLDRDPNAFNDKLTPYQSGEPQGDRGWQTGCDHPPYEENDYNCAVCGKALTERDD